MWGKLSTTCSNIQKSPNGELLVALDHNQQQTMASETVDPIDWSHRHPGQYPWASCIAWCKRGLRISRLAAATGTQSTGMSDQSLCGHSGYMKIIHPEWYIIFTTLPITADYENQSVIGHRRGRRILFTGWHWSVASKQGNYSDEEDAVPRRGPEHLQFISEKDETYRMGQYQSNKRRLASLDLKSKVIRHFKIYLGIHFVLLK